MVEGRELTNSGTQASEEGEEWDGGGVVIYEGEEANL
jgi:hypothetical protein